MRFYNCYSDDTGGSYTSGCNSLREAIDEIESNNYSEIWSAVNSEGATGGTPLSSALNEAKLYLDYHKNNDPAKACRKKFVILITDGADTFACGGNGSEGQSTQYKRRRETVAKAKALADAGYNVFVIGFGAEMPHFLRYTLNWAAYYGRTDNPDISNSGDTGGYNIPTGSLYPSGITSCQDSTTSSHNLGEGTHYYATSNDPGEAPLNGYAFLATDASQLTEALKTIAKYIQEQCYSFTSPTVPSVQVVVGDIMYISSFTPKENNPFWEGDLKAYRLNEDGTLPVDADGYPLESSRIWTESIPTTRKIKTYRRGEFVDFTSSYITRDDLGVSTDGERDSLISYIRALPLGDIFHSNAVIVGEPSRFFEDTGYSGTGGFYENNKNRTKVVIVGANDGMLHAFNASTGVEEWAFIPQSILQNLKSMLTNHTYYVDSSPRVSDVWFDYNGDGIKTANEWRTVLICGLRKGGKHYFALDITDTLNPVYLWEFPSDGTTLSKVGESWSEPVIRRVKINIGGGVKEKWVAFIGGGFDDTNNTGKALFVIDIRTGNIIKEFSGITGMDHCFPAPPTVIDKNSDGYADKVYIGDLGGQMWVFDVSNEDTDQWSAQILFRAPSGTSEKHKIFYQPAVAFDNYRNPWVFFGTGDRENPKDYTNPRERFYAVRDDGVGNYPRTEGDLTDVTTNPSSFTPDLNKKGWDIKMEKSEQTLENMLSKYLSGGGALLVDDLSDLLGTPTIRSKEIGGGAPSSPVITVNLKGKASVIIGTTLGKVYSAQIFSMQKMKDPLYWREVIP